MVSKPIEDVVGSEVAKVGDGLSLGAVVTAWLGIVPEVLQIVSLSVAIIWTLIRIYETDTVQRILKRKK